VAIVGESGRKGRGGAVCFLVKGWGDSKESVGRCHIPGLEATSSVRYSLFRLRQRWRSLTGRLQPMLGPLPESARGGALVPSVVEGSRRDEISRLFNAFGRSSRLTDRLMVVSDASVFQSVAEALLVELAAIEWMLDRLEID